MRPPERNATPPGSAVGGDLYGTLAMVAILGVGGFTTLFWAGTQLAAVVTTGRTVPVGLPETADALVELPGHWGDPAAAWPPHVSSHLPGPWLYWPSLLAVAALTAAGVGYAWRWWHQRTADGPLGVTPNAGFARARDIKQLKVDEASHGRVTLGYRGRTLLAAEPQVSLAVIGPTGCGKTAGFAIPALLEWQGPVIATSVKNDLLEPTLEHRQKLGHVWIYDPSGKSGHATNRWSPLSTCDTWAGAMRIAAWLCEAAQPKFDTVTDGDYWYSQARKALAPYLHAAAIEETTMATVVRWIDSQEVDEVRAILRHSSGLETEIARLRTTEEAGQQRAALTTEIENQLVAGVRKGHTLLPGSTTKRSWQHQPLSQWPISVQEELANLVKDRVDDQFNAELERQAATKLRSSGALDALIAAESLWHKEDRLRGSVFATVENVLAGYADPGVAEASSASDFTMEEWLSGPNTIYISAPPHEQARLRPVLSALLQQAIRTAYDTANNENGTLERPCLVLLDEAGNIAPLRDLPTYASTARSHGITLVTIWQDLAQIKAVYRDRAQTVLNNHQAKLFGAGQSDDATLDYLSRLVGDERRTEINRSGDLTTGRRSINEHAAYRRAAPADVLRRLRTHEAVLIYGNKLPVHLRLRPWWQKPRHLSVRLLRGHRDQRGGYEAAQEPADERSGGRPSDRDLAPRCAPARRRAVADLPVRPTGGDRSPRPQGTRPACTHPSTPGQRADQDQRPAGH